MKGDTIKILFIGDDELQYKVIEKCLLQVSEFQYELEWINTYEGAIATITAQQHDVYLVDYQLGSYCGINIIRQTVSKGCQAPMILQIPHKPQNPEREAMNLGAVDYLIKSEINSMLLERSIRYAIHQKKIETQLATQHEIITQHVKEAERTNQYLIELTQRIAEELEQARQTQLALLPQNLPTDAGCHFATKFQPMQQIGGDFYDLFELSENQTGILLADVTGHGIPAALISFMVSSLFKTFAPKIHDVEKTIRRVNNSLYGKIPDTRYATLFYCIYDKPTQNLVYSSMGHPPGYLIRSQTQELIPLKSTGVLLGVFPIKANQTIAASQQLLPGDKIFLYTDGLIEVFNKAGKLFGETQLQKFLKEYQQLSIHELVERAYAYTLDYSESVDFQDDVTVVGFELPKNEQ